MKRIFVDSLAADELTITGDDAHHLAYALRAKRGDKITAVDKIGNCAVVELVDFDKETITARRIGDVKKISAEKKIILADCLPKQNRFDNIIEKATELGIDKIIPLISERTIVRPDNLRGQSKVERWKKIAKESAEQCARDTIPEIDNICALDDWLKKISPLDNDTLLLFCWELERDTTAREVLSVNRDKNIIVLIGPEGGFSECEVQAVKNIGGISVTLGKRILKTDTAAISVLAMINYERM